jgi:hypothetical protein
MLTLESLSPDKKLSAFLAIKFAEKGLPAYEVHFPEDKRPRAAIEAAKEWLNDSSVDNADAVYAAANAAADAANAAADAARAATDSYSARAARAARAAAYAASNAAAYAVYVADAAYAAGWAADAADSDANAAAWAADALGKDKASFIHSVLMENADVILEHMVKEEVAS